MHPIIAKTYAVAGLGLAALTIVAAGFANAAPATIKISDLDLSRPSHVAVYNRRVDAAADRFCGGHSTLENKTACRASIRAEAAGQLALARGVTVASR